MAFTSELGIRDSRLGNFSFGIPTTGDPLSQSLTSPLLLTGNIARDIEVSVAQSLLLNDVAGRDKFGEASNVLSFTQSILSDLTTLLEDNLELFEVLVDFVELADTYPFPETLNLIQEVVVETTIKEKSLSQRLNINDNVNLCYGAPWTPIVIQDILAFVGDEARINTPVSVSSSLGLTQELFNRSTSFNILNLTQTVSAGKAKISKQFIVFLQEVIADIDYQRELENSDILKQSVAYYIDSKCNRKLYARFEGEGTNTESFNEKRLVFDADFMMETLDATAETIYLRNPEIDDRDRIAFNRINRETRGGELNVYTDPAWAKVNNLQYTIVAIKPDKIAALQAFMLKHIGKEIRLQDWTGTSWKGIITTPNEAATEDEEGYWTFAFEFEGVAYPGIPSFDAIQMVDEFDLLAIWTRLASNLLELNQVPSVDVDYIRGVNDPITFSQDATGVI